MTLVIAHRGASADAPENTMAAFALAHQHGAEMCELDVQLSADGVAVVFHDGTTGRFEARSRPVAACTLAMLQRLDVGGGAQVPTLAEVCDFARSHGMQLNIELKDRRVAQATARAVTDAGIAEQVIISSFDTVALRAIAAAAHKLPRAYLMGSRTPRPDVRFREAWPLIALRAVGASAWHPYVGLPLLRRVIPVVRRAGYMVNVWTVNTDAQFRELRDLGVDGIITDHPARLRAMLDAVPTV